MVGLRYGRAALTTATPTGPITQHRTHPVQDEVGAEQHAIQRHEHAVVQQRNAYEHGHAECNRRHKQHVHLLHGRLWEVAYVSDHTNLHVRSDML